MRFFRGIAVPADRAEITMAEIGRNGLASGQGKWQMEHEHPGDLDGLHLKPDLSRRDTRPDLMVVDAVCACGDADGALYYACSHNISPINTTPILIEFEAEASHVAIDGKDFLYTAFQMGAPERARPILERSFGTAVLRYVDLAWSSGDQSFRIAQCDLAIHDPNVIEAHCASDVVLAGRHRTIFRSAFTIQLPVPPESVLSVSSPSSTWYKPQPDVKLSEIIRIAP
jgi:hypothetical protein